MKNYKNILLKPTSTIKEALQIIDTGAIKFAIIVNNNDQLIGTITDGDIRRAILNGKSLDSKIDNIYFKNPTTVTIHNTIDEIINICTAKKIYQIPVIDDEQKVVDIKILDEILKPKVYQNKVVLMAGGLGTRLRPLTNDTPKPMLNVGGKPILQTIVERFASYGFVDIIISLGYKAEIIENYFEDGSKFGVNISYIYENKRMGTAGALSLLDKKQKSNEPFFVMNGDILTDVNFESMMQFHLSNCATATMGVGEYEYEIPYGVVNIDGNKIYSIEEKPLHKAFINGGIYILNSNSIDLIPNDTFYDMPTLFDLLLKKDEFIASFAIKDYWLDIGRTKEYEKANLEYQNIF
jgi:dTDP-glucose pyrophosphorylase